MEEATTARESIARRGWHDSPCGDLRALEVAVEALAEDRRRLNGSIGRIDEHMGDLHEKVNALALQAQRDLAEVKVSLAAAQMDTAKTLSNAGWKVLAAIMTAGLGLGSAITMLVISRLVP